MATRVTSKEFLIPLAVGVAIGYVLWHHKSPMAARRRPAPAPAQQQG